MNLQNRVENLERQTGAESGVCECHTVGCRDVCAYMDAEDNHAAAAVDTRPPASCDLCGLPKRIIQIVVVYGDGEREN